MIELTRKFSDENIKGKKIFDFELKNLNGNTMQQQQMMMRGLYGLK